LELLGNNSGNALKQGVIDMNDFVTSHRDDHPELDNFLGFMENSAQAEDVQMEN